MSGAFNRWACEMRSRWLAWQAGDGPMRLARALDQCKSDVPVLLISYNNGVYVEHMVRQLKGFGVSPIVLDNRSGDDETRRILSRLDKGNDASVICLDRNFGHKVAFLPPFYDQLPDVFACSDPDLLLNERMPRDFLSQLHQVAQHFQVYKAGLALELPDDLELISNTYQKKKCKPFAFQRQYSVREWEQRFWHKRLSHPSLEVYAAPIDTTMAVYDKRLYDGVFFEAVRVAGDFGCLHMPWHPQLDLFDASTRQKYLQGNRSSSWLKDR